MSDRAALLRKIIDNPEDDTARLVYADWIEEFDAPNGGAELAAYIRAAVRGGNEAARADYNRMVKRPGFVGSMIQFRSQWPVFHSDTYKVVREVAVLVRGFIGHLHCTLPVFNEMCAEMFDTHPIERVTVSDLTPREFSDLGTTGVGWRIEDVGEVITARLIAHYWCIQAPTPSVRATLFPGAACAIDALSDVLVEIGRAGRDTTRRERKVSQT